MKAVYKKIREMMIYKGVRGRAAHIFGVIMLVFLGLVFAMPLYWMISTALKYETYCFTTPPQWFPNPIKWSNFTEIFGRMDMARYIKNTLITSILPVIGTLSVSDHFDDDDDPIDGNADSNVCDMVKAGNAEYIHSPGIAQFFWKHLLYLFVSAVYEVVADQRNRSRPY